jgi:hypothetical protein
LLSVAIPDRPEENRDAKYARREAAGLMCAIAGAGPRADDLRRAVERNIVDIRGAGC